MIIGIIGENCSGKSTLAEKVKAELGAEIISGKDWLRMAKSEDEARSRFREKLKNALTGENVIYAVLPGDYSGSLLFLFENGKAARVELAAYKTTSNRRKLTGAYGDKSPLVSMTRLEEDRELAVYSTEPRVVIFHTALLVPKTTRSSQGVQLINLKKNYRPERICPVEETAITNASRYRVRALPAAGALLKEEDSEEKQIGLLE